MKRTDWEWSYNTGIGQEGSLHTNLSEDAGEKSTIGAATQIPALHVARCRTSDSCHLALLALVQGRVVLVGRNYAEHSCLSEIYFCAPQ